MVTDECKPLTRARVKKVYIEASPCVTHAPDLHKREPATLAEGLKTLAENGDLTPCQRDPDPFTSDDPDDRAEAALACHMCRLIDLWHEHAETTGERWHVWGGTDRTITRKKRP